VKKKKSGVGTNFVIHKYFYERDSSWQQIRNEEAQANGTPSAELQVPDDSQIHEGDSKVTISFDPIDTRHLSSLPLVRGRLVKLLKASQNNIHSSTNMLVAIVCVV
jgi:oxalate---CoA ligase